ncbi:MAG TPA: TIGR00282 family metallophosphoesterase [Clostridiales bacterium]|nr:TIGR00282 family metallophosphoesterase [Clostridiales bacterium]
MPVNILAVGDIAGKCGLDILSRRLRSIQRLEKIRFTVVNGENAAGIGITPQQAREILSAGADVITLGNHTWGKQEIAETLDDSPYILRPSNFAPQVPGRGLGVYETSFGEVAVINLIGRCNMDFGPDNPFLEADRLLKKLSAKIILVDFHAEATSEKLALAGYLDGRVSALWGTHTHVQTSDACVLPRGTGYITDLGMTGPINSVIGVKTEISISFFLGNPPRRFEAADGEGKLECAVFEIDEKTGRCLGVKALRITD